MEMSSWLGFSLSSAKAEEFDGGGGGGGGEGGVGGGRGGGDGGVGPLVLMPLSSDASVCLMESPLRQPQTSERKSDEIASAATVAATTTTASPNPDEQEPKFEDFLGGYSENSNEENHPRQHQPIPYFCDVCHSHSSGAPEINVNMPPSSAIAESEPTMENADAPYRYLHSNCHHHHHTLKPAFLIADATQNFTANAICNVGTEGSTSISSMKSWLRQQPAEANEARSLSLSMTSGFQMGSHEIVEEAVTDPKCLNGKSTTSGLVPRKSIETFGQRTSQYRGVTRHRWTGRYEAHLWDNSCRREGQSRKGRQVYLGGYDKEEKAARAYDLAALKYWGPTTHTNFPLSTYEKELKAMKNTTRQEFVANLRRKSSGFSRGASVYRGVTRHHQHGRWQARIGRVAGNKDLYLGTFSTQEEAAEAYDIATIKFRGPNAVTNFDISKYDAKLICSSSHLIGGELAKRSPKETNPALSELAVIDSTKSGADELSEAWPNLTLDTLPFTWPSTSTDPDWLGAKVETFKHQVSYHNMYGDYSHGFFYTSAATDYELGRYGDGCGGANWMVAAGKQPPAFTLWND